LPCTTLLATSVLLAEAPISAMVIAPPVTPAAAKISKASFETKATLNCEPPVTVATTTIAAHTVLVRDDDATHVPLAIVCDLPKLTPDMAKRFEPHHRHSSGQPDAVAALLRKIEDQLRYGADKKLETMLHTYFADSVPE
jgi:hypothetical protein